MKHVLLFQTWIYMQNEKGNLDISKVSVVNKKVIYKINMFTFIRWIAMYFTML